MFFVSSVVSFTVDLLSPRIFSPLGVRLCGLGSTVYLILGRFGPLVGLRATRRAVVGGVAERDAVNGTGVCCQGVLSGAKDEAEAGHRVGGARWPGVSHGDPAADAAHT